MEDGPLRGPRDESELPDRLSRAFRARVLHEKAVGATRPTARDPSGSRSFSLEMHHGAHPSPALHPTPHPLPALGCLPPQTMAKMLGVALTPMVASAINRRCGPRFSPWLRRSSTIFITSFAVVYCAYHMVARAK